MDKTTLLTIAVILGVIVILGFIAYYSDNPEIVSDIADIIGDLADD